jgi:hypothetical protein
VLLQEGAERQELDPHVIKRPRAFSTLAPRHAGAIIERHLTHSNHVQTPDHARIERHSGVEETARSADLHDGDRNRTPQHSRNGRSPGPASAADVVSFQSYPMTDDALLDRRRTGTRVTIEVATREIECDGLVPAYGLDALDPHRARLDTLDDDVAAGPELTPPRLSQGESCMPPSQASILPSRLHEAPRPKELTQQLRCPRARVLASGFPEQIVQEGERLMPSR